MNSEDIKDIKSLLTTSKNIVIVPHRNPDGDAYGASLGLYHYLKKFGHQVTVVSPNDCPNFLKWMPDNDKVLVFEENISKGTEVLEDAEIVFTLDFNALHRVGDKMLKVLEGVDPVYILIDHHQQPEEFAKYIYSDSKISSTCEMIYLFIDMLQDLSKIDKDIASCLYAGILTDTGNFRFPATSSQTHRIAADMLDRGVEHAKIYNKIHDNSVSRLQLLGTALSNMVVLPKYKAAYITLSNRELQKFNFKKGDTEGFVNYALSLNDINFAAIFIEDRKQGIIKISFRSIGDFNVNEVSRKHFNGGGHINAAGGRTEKSLKETVSYFQSILPGYEEKLNNVHE
ncbi:MAG: bifunctional oligoribonuclease/PAP phosphatase NrnA [Bacteroidota bacterium]